MIAPVFRPMLERRLTRLENRLKIPKEERHICEGSLARPEIVRIEGVRVEHRAGNLVLDKNLKVVRKPPSFTQTSGLTQQPLPWTQGNVNVKVEPTTEVCMSPQS